MIKKGLIRCTYTIKGDKLNYISEYLRYRNISFYNAKYIDNNLIKITVDFCDRRKFFAICKNMCYNIQKIEYKGLLSPFIYVFKNIGVFIGVILFIVLSVLSNDYILAIDYTGTGSIISSEISKTISNNGANIFGKFSNLDVESLANTVLQSNKNLSFVSIKKQGNRLIVNSVLNNEAPSINDKNTIDLTAPINGVIERVNVLRGTPLVKVGDVVLSGDVLVGAYITDKNGEKYQTYIVASVHIIEEKTVFIKTNYVDDNVIEKVMQIAVFDESGEVVSKTASQTDGGVNVTMKIRHIVGG